MIDVIANRYAEALFQIGEDASACASAIIWLDFSSALEVACLIISLPSST